MCIGGVPTPLKVSNGAVYLGMKLNPRGEWSNHRRYRAKKARRWRWRVSSAARKRGALPISAALKMGRSGEAAALCYGAELWANTEGAAFDQVEIAQARQERRILGLPDRTPNAVVRHEAGTRSWSGHALRLRLNLLAKVCHPTSEVDKDITYAVVTARVKAIGDCSPVTREADWVGRSKAIVESIWEDPADARAAWRALTDGKTPLLDVEKDVQTSVEQWEDRVLKSRLERTARWETATLGGPMGVLWRGARDELTGDDVRWVEHVRAGVLAVAEETGRWEGKPRRDRVCPLCCMRCETAAHLLRDCPQVESTRASVNAHLTSICGTEVQATGVLLAICGQGHLDPPESRSQKKVWLRALNSAIGRMMEAREHELNPPGKEGRASVEPWKEISP
jgi:hypothetical protein